MNNKKNTILTVFGISILMVALVGATFAYFTAQQGGTTTRDVSITSNTTDNLSFTIGNDISFTASEANFYQGGTNVSGSTSASAILTPNNNTNQATMNYYMYLNLTSNPTVYSTGNTNEDAELILQVFDGSNNLVTLTGLGSQVALGNGYGYDITGQEGLITLLNNHAITANGSATTENWSVVITLVNLNLDQNDNTHKTITGEIIMTKNAISDFPYQLTPGVYTANTDGYYTIIGQTISEEINTYNDLSSAIQGEEIWEDIVTRYNLAPVALKHVLNQNDDTITETYVEFEVVNELKTENDTMRVGNYEVRGAVDETSLPAANQSVYIRNKAFLDRAFGEDLCHEDMHDSDKTYYCSAQSTNYHLYVSVNNAGEVEAGIDGDMPHCIINPDYGEGASSFCYT